MGNFFKFDRYQTPSIIRIFYFLQVILIALFTLFGVGAGLFMMSNSAMLGIGYLIMTLFSGVVALLGARIFTEVVMVFFQNNEHLAALRGRTESASTF